MEKVPVKSARENDLSQPTGESGESRESKLQTTSAQDIVGNPSSSQSSSDSETITNQTQPAPVYIKYARYDEEIGCTYDSRGLIVLKDVPDDVQGKRWYDSETNCSFSEYGEILSRDGVSVERFSSSSDEEGSEEDSVQLANSEREGDTGESDLSRGNGDMNL